MLLLRVEPNSAGNYTCSSHKSNTATVSINVVHGIILKLFYALFIINSDETGERTPEAMLKEQMKMSSGSDERILNNVSVIIVAQMLTMNLVFKKL